MCRLFSSVSLSSSFILKSKDSLAGFIGSRDGAFMPLYAAIMCCRINCGLFCPFKRTQKGHAYSLELGLSGLGGEANTRPLILKGTNLDLVVRA